MPGSPPIAVTGMAWWTALGSDLGSVWQALLAGQHGFRPVEHAGRMRNTLAAAAADQSIPPAERMLLMGSRTIRSAMEAAGREASDPNVQFVLGTSLAAYLDDENSRRSLSGWAEDIAISLGSSAQPYLVSTACSASSDAIMVGAEMIRSGMAQCCVVGGVDVLSASKRIAHSSLGTMSPTILRAFDVRHDGTLLGEGAGFLVLESSKTARQPLAFLRGAGSANDATGMTVADVTGLSARYAMNRSLDDAGISADSIGVINAHGSGTIINDTTECNAYRDQFAGSTKPLVFGTKGNFGHSLGATGAIEAIALILALREKQVPPVASLEQPDPKFPLPLAWNGPVNCNAKMGLSLTLGFGGFDTSLIFEAA